MRIRATKFHHKMKNFYIKQNATDFHNVGDLVIAYADSDDMRLNEYGLILVLNVLRRANGMTDYTLFGIQRCTLMHITRGSRQPNTIFLVNIKDIMPYNVIRSPY